MESLSPPVQRIVSLIRQLTLVGSDQICANKTKTAPTTLLAQPSAQTQVGNCGSLKSVVGSVDPEFRYGCYDGA